MPVKVLDASALCAMLFGEPEAEAVAGRLTGAVLAAPALLGFEVANVCLKKIRSHPDRREALLAAFENYDRLSVEIIEVDRRAVLRLADASGFTAYDGAYLALARALDAEIVTLDRKLQAAADAGASGKEA